MYPSASSIVKYMGYSVSCLPRHFNHLDRNICIPSHQDRQYSVLYCDNLIVNEPLISFYHITKDRFFSFKDKCDYRIHMPTHSINVSL